MWNKPAESQVVDLESRIADLEARLNATMGLLTLIRPASTALTDCGVDGTRRDEFYRVIDDMTTRVGSGFSVSYAEFEERLSSMLPNKRGDRKFFALLIEALKLERPQAKPMLDYLSHAMALFRD